MAGSIGKLSLQLSASPSQFLSDLARAEAGLKHLSDEKKIKQWADLNTSALTKMGKAAASSLGGLGVSAAKGLAGSVKGGVASLASSGVGAITGVVADLFGPESVFNTIKELDRTAALADSLNIDVEALTGLQHAARVSGVDVEALSHGLKHMERTLGNASLAAEVGSRSLESFGLDSKALAAELPLDAILKMADKVRDLAPGVDRVAFATTAWGKSSADLLPLLSKGSAEIKRLAEEGKLFGQVLTAGQAVEVAKAREAIVEIEQAYAGLKKQVAIGLAPLISDAASGFKEWLKGIGGVEGAAKILLGTFLDIAEAVVEVVKAVSELVGDVKKLPGKATSFLGAPAGAAVVTGAGDTGIAGLLAGLGGKSAASSTSGIDKVLDLLKRARSGVDLIGSGTKAAPDPLKRALERQKELQVATDAVTESLRRQIATLGLSEAEVKRNDLIVASASSLQIQKINEQLDKLEKLKHSQEQFQTAAAIVDTNTNFAEKFIEELEQLDDLFKSGKLGIEQWGRAASRATSAFFDAGGMALGLPTGLQQGSSEAISAVNRAEQSAQKGTQNPFKVAEDLLRTLNDIERQQLALLQKQAAEAGGPIAPLIPGR